MLYKISRIHETLNILTNATSSTNTKKTIYILNFNFWLLVGKLFSLVLEWGRGPKSPLPERLTNARRPYKKIASDGTDEQTNHGHRYLETELAQWVESLKSSLSTLHCAHYSTLCMACFQCVVYIALHTFSPSKITFQTYKWVMLI